MFYDSDLKAMIDSTTSDEAQILNRLQVILPVDVQPNTHGVIFVNVEGSNKKNDDSPSWYNCEEADSVSMKTKWVEVLAVLTCVRFVGFWIFY